MRAGLPIDSIASAVMNATGPLVITAPPGSGKSTRVPLWLAENGPVLAVQPRRLAARSLAHHIAAELGSPIGHEVGFAVRGEARDHGARVLFVTTGVALKLVEQGIDRFKTVILDEFHERSLDLDLLAALVERSPCRLVVLSATIDATRIAAHFGALHLHAPGTMFPVELFHTGSGRTLPSRDGLEKRVLQALEAHRDVPGDRLIFVPGKAEIEAVCRVVPGPALPLHGGLTLAQQNRVLKPAAVQRTIVATNVAETSLTLPNIGLVIDSGLVRRTHYHQDRGYLALTPIAFDSADQRSGRAGRLGPGVAVRLWGAAATLLAHTPPAMHRESLVGLVLAAVACGVAPEQLRFVDPPAAHALQTARDELHRLGALERGTLSPLGRELFRLPTAPHLARLLIAAREHGLLGRGIDLVAALGSRRPLWVRATEAHRCDLTAMLVAMERGSADDGFDEAALREARREATRLRSAFSYSGREPWTSDRMAALILTAWPSSAHVARRRKRGLAWSNGGTEVALSRRSMVPETSAAVLALGFRAHGTGKDRKLEITAALPRTLEQLAHLGLGTPHLDRTTVEKGVVVSKIQTLYAGAVLRTEDRTPTGLLAAEAVAHLLLRGTLRKGFTKRFAAAHRLAALWADLDRRPPPNDDLVRTLVDRGLEHPDDLLLLEEADLLPEPPPRAVAAQLEKEFPATFTIQGARFRVEVSPRAQEVVLHNLGARLKTYPPPSWLPRFRGWRVVLLDRGVRRVLR